MNENVIKIILVLLGLGGAILWKALRQRRRARDITDTPRSKIASAPQGLVEFQGFAWPNNNQVAKAINGQDLVYQEFLLQRLETTGSGKNKRKTWKTVYSRYHKETFYVADATGLAIVDPAISEVSLKDARTELWKSLGKDEKARIVEQIVTESIADFPPEEGFFKKLFAKEYRVVEKEIRIGSPIYLSGHFESLTDGVMKTTEIGLTYFSKKVFKRKERATKDLTKVLDSNQDGIVSSDEARNGYSMAAHVARARSFMNNTKEDEFEIFGLIRQSNDHKLFIADETEDKIVDRLLRFNKLKLAAGSAMVIAGLTFAVAPQMASPEALLQVVNNVRASFTREPAKEDSYLASTMTLLHEMCTTQKDGKACANLVESADKFHLTEQYRAYYRGAACRQGVQEQCETRNPAAAVQPHSRNRSKVQ